MFHINNSISLDVVHVWVLYAQLFAISLCSADDAGGDSVLQGERAANGNHKLSWPQISRTAQRQHAKFLLLQQAQNHSKNTSTQAKTRVCQSNTDEKKKRHLEEEE